MTTDDSLVIGQASATHQPHANDSKTDVQICLCEKRVPPAARSILGHCEYYYRPLHGEFVRKTGVSTWQAVKAWATVWNPLDDVDVYTRLLQNRDKLIQAESADSDWSRHANFMVRHIGCGHRPPDYYVSYGYYYCSTYGARLYPRLTDEGKRWIERARWQLHKNMEDGLQQNMQGDEIVIVCKKYPNRTVRMNASQFELETSPSRFKTFAFKTHVPAYLDAGLDELPLDDLLKIGGQPDFEEWLDRDTWQQALESGAEVAKQKALRAAGAVQRALQALVRHLS